MPVLCLVFSINLVNLGIPGVDKLLLVALLLKSIGSWLLEAASVGGDPFSALPIITVQMTLADRTIHSGGTYNTLYWLTMTVIALFNNMFNIPNLPV